MSMSACTRHATAGCRTCRDTLASLLVGPRLLFCILSLSSGTSQDSPWQTDRKCHTKRDKRQSLSRNGYRYDAYCSICFIPPLVPQHLLRPSPHTTIPPLRPPPHHRPFTHLCTSLAPYPTANTLKKYKLHQHLCIAAVSTLPPQHFTFFHCKHRSTLFQAALVHSIPSHPTSVKCGEFCPAQLGKGRQRQAKAGKQAGMQANDQAINQRSKHVSLEHRKAQI